MGSGYPIRGEQEIIILKLARNGVTPEQIAAQVRRHKKTIKGLLDRRGVPWERERKGR